MQSHLQNPNYKEIHMLSYYQDKIINHSDKNLNGSIIFCFQAIKIILKAYEIAKKQGETVPNFMYFKKQKLRAEI